MKLSKGFLERSAKSIGALLLLLLAASCSEATGGTQPMGESKFVDVDGIRTRYFEGGSGEAMVAITVRQAEPLGGCPFSRNWLPISMCMPSTNLEWVLPITLAGMKITDLAP